jgi:5-methylcytosine-specific restriction endonuclease McrA
VPFISDPASLEEQLDAEFGCTCLSTELRKRTHRDGRTAYVQQCLRCGTMSSALKQSALGLSARLSAAPADEEAPRKWSEARWARRQELYSADRRSEAEEWWAYYEAHLRSEAWRRKRRLVFERDGGGCQARMEGCTERASQVHHLSYRHLGDEPLFELVSVCDACHGRLHPRHGGEVPAW